MNMNIQLEVIALSVEDALAAERGGADRIELVAELDVGGTTPAPDVVREMCGAVSIPVYAMIRPRGGDAVYTPDEIAVMLDAAEMVREAGADGIVVGASRPDGFIDVDVLGRIVEAAALPVTFHKAFDAVPAHLMPAALDELEALPGLERVLTSGGAANVMQGRPALKELVEHDTLSIMPGGGVTAANARQLVADTGVREIHVGGAARFSLQAATASKPAAIDIDVPIYKRPVNEDAVRQLKRLLTAATKNDT